MSPKDDLMMFWLFGVKPGEVFELYDCQKRVLERGLADLDREKLERCFAKPDTKEQNLIDLCWEAAEIDV